MKSQVTLKTIAKFADQKNRNGIGYPIKLQAQYHGSET